MYIYVDDIYIVVYFNDVCYFSLVYIVYINNVVIMFCFLFSVCIIKKIMKVRLMFLFLCGLLKDFGSCCGFFGFQILGNWSLRFKSLNVMKILIILEFVY